MPAAKPELHAIAQALGVNIRTVTNWRKRAGFPNGGTPEAVRAWAEEQGLHRISDGSLGSLRADLLRRDIELRDLKIARERGDVIDREVVEEMLGVLAQKLDLLLRLKLEVELGPRVAGKSAAEANVEGGAILEEIREVVAGNIANFQAEALAGTRDDEGDA
jgi:hypothetical protein